MSQISEKTLEYIKIIASNKKVQSEILDAMFSGCEPDTDIFEWCDFSSLTREESKMLFGQYPEDEDENWDIIDQNAIYRNPMSAFILIKTVKDNLLKSLK